MGRFMHCTNQLIFYIYIYRESYAEAAGVRVLLSALHLVWTVCIEAAINLHLRMFPPWLLDDDDAESPWRPSLKPEQPRSSLCCFLQTSGPRSLRTRTRLHGAAARGRSQSCLEKLRADEADLLQPAAWLLLEPSVPKVRGQINMTCCDSHTGMSINTHRSDTQPLLRYLYTCVFCLLS